MFDPSSQGRSRAALASTSRWGAGLADRIRPRLNAWRDEAQEAWSDPRRRRRALTWGAVFSILSLAIIVLVAVWDWDWFRGPIARYASARTGREVQITGHLEVHPFSWTPSAAIGGLQVGNPAWMKTGKRMVDLGRTTVQIKLLPLLKGQTILPLVDIEHPNLDLYRDRKGRANWQLGQASGTPAKLPVIQHFILRDGRIRIVDDQRRARFEGVVTTSEGGPATGQPGFRIDGWGALNGAPFTAHVTGDPLIGVKKDVPYPFRAEVRAGATSIYARGQIDRPFDFGRIRTGLAVRGPNLADLYGLTGLVFPNTPPYAISGALTRDGTTFEFRGFRGRVGASDLHGELTVKTVSGRRVLKGDLGSAVLDFKDLGALFGATPRGHAPGGAPRAAPVGRLLPDAPLMADRVRAMDADVRYHADSVRAPNLPLRQVSLHLKLDHGLLTLDPVAFSFPRGQLAGKASLNARGATPFTDVDLAVTNVRLEDVLPRPQGLKAMNGVIEARAKLAGPGDTVHRAAAASNGHVSVAIPGGQVRQALAELMGVNVVPGAFQFLGKNTKQTELRCAVAEFDVNNGVLVARRMVMDTGVVVLAGGGSVNLGSERVDLTLKGKPKKPRLMRVIAPFHLQGSLAAPRFKVETGPAIAQAGVGAALGSVLSPLAAIIPFLSPGGAKDQNCAALLGEARAAGAPVK